MNEATPWPDGALFGVHIHTSSVTVLMQICTTKTSVDRREQSGIRRNRPLLSWPNNIRVLLYVNMRDRNGFEIDRVFFPLLQSHALHHIYLCSFLSLPACSACCTFDDNPIWMLQARYHVALDWLVFLWLFFLWRWFISLSPIDRPLWSDHVVLHAFKRARSQPLFLSFV